MSIRPFWLSVGAIGGALCIASTASIVASYLRHRPSGDQAGTGLETLFLVLWLLPLATIPLLIGLGKPPAGETASEPARAPIWASILLVVNGCGLAAFTNWFVVSQLTDIGSGWPDWTGVVWASGYMVFLLGVAGVWLALGSSGFRATTRAAIGALPAILVTTLIASIVVNASLLHEAVRGASPGPNMWGGLIQDLLLFCPPSLILMSLLARRARALALGKPRSA